MFLEVSFPLSPISFYLNYTSKLRLHAVNQLINQSYRDIPLSTYQTQDEFTKSRLRYRYTGLQLYVIGG